MSAVEVAAELWRRRFPARALPRDRDELAQLLIEEAPDDANVILDAVRGAGFGEFVAAVGRAS